MNSVLLGVLLFIAFQLVLGVAVSRTVRNEEDYLLAGRSLGSGLVCLSVFATWFGAETCISSASGLYEKGLAGGAAEPFGYGLCIIFYGLAFAMPLWRRHLITVADLFRDRFSAGVERLAVLILAVTSMFWAAAQIRAFGQVLSASAGIEVELTITLAAVVAMVYTSLGGLRADVITDVIQGIVIIIGLVVLLVTVVGDLGGLHATWGRVDPDRLNLLESGRSVWALLETWAIPIFGSVVAQELASRTMAARSGRIARNATLLGGALYLLVGAIPAFLGLIGPSLMPDIGNPEQILPRLAQTYLPTLGYILFAGALISAILSSVDSALLASSALISHNLVLPFCKNAGDRTKVRMARAGVWVCGLVSWGLALSADTIYELVEASSAFGGAGMVVILVFGLFGRRGDHRAAYAALGAAMMAWGLASRIESYPAPYLTSLVLGVIAYCAVAALTAPGLKKIR